MCCCCCGTATGMAVCGGGAATGMEFVSPALTAGAGEGPPFVVAIATGCCETAGGAI